MSLPLTKAKLYGYRPGNHSDLPSEADYEIPGIDLNVVDISSRAGPLRDSAKLRIDNQGGKYTDTIDHGDRLRFTANTTAAVNEGFGVGGFGEGPFGSTLEHFWTGMVRPYSITGRGGDLFEFAVDGQDYVQAILGMRRVYGAWEDAKIVGQGGILNSVLSDEAPEIDQSQLPDLDARTDIFVSGAKLMDFVGELAERAGVIVSSDRRALRFDHPSSIQAAFELQPRDHHTLEFKSKDDNLVNSVRIDGGQDHEPGGSQTTQSAYQTVTETSRLHQRLTHWKSQIDRIEVWTRPTGSEESVTVRLQKDQGGAPIAPGAKKPDLARKKLAHHFLAQDGYTTFKLPDHDIPGDDPWILIETDGSQGQDIGVDANGNATYKSHFLYPVNVNIPDPTSQTEYGLREDRLKDDSITTFTAAEDLAEAHLQQYSTPTETLSFRANSERADRLAAGSVLQLDYPRMGARGMYVVTERQSTLDGGRILNDLALRRLPDALAADVTPPTQ